MTGPSVVARRRRARPRRRRPSTRRRSWAGRRAGPTRSPSWCRCLRARPGARRPRIGARRRSRRPGSGCRDGARRGSRTHCSCRGTPGSPSRTTACRSRRRVPSAARGVRLRRPSWWCPRRTRRPTGSPSRRPNRTWPRSRPARAAGKARIRLHSESLASARDSMGEKRYIGPRRRWGRALCRRRRFHRRRAGPASTAMSTIVPMTSRTSARCARLDRSFTHRWYATWKRRGMSRRLGMRSRGPSARSRFRSRSCARVAAGHESGTFCSGRVSNTQLLIGKLPGEKCSVPS